MKPEKSLKSSGLRTYGAKSPSIEDHGVATLRTTQPSCRPVIRQAADAKVRLSVGEDHLHLDIRGTVARL